MPTMKEALILIREAQKMVTNKTINNCWKKAGIIDFEEKGEEIDSLIESHFLHFLEYKILHFLAKHVLF